MVGIFLILNLLFLGGTSLAKTTSEASASNSNAKNLIYTIGESLVDVFQTSECGPNCKILQQIPSPTSDSDPLTTKLADLYSELVSHYKSVYTPGLIYFTPKQLKEEIIFQKDILNKMEKLGADPNNLYFTKIANYLSTSLQHHQDSLHKMESENLVLVLNNNKVSYTPQKDYKYQVKKSKREEKIQSLFKPSMSAAEIFSFYDALTELDEILKPDDTCFINQVKYTYKDLATYMDSVLELAHVTERQERLQTAVATITFHYTSAGQFWSKTQIKELMDSWDSLIKLLHPDETISIMSVEFTLDHIKEKYSELKIIYQKLHIGEISTFNQKGDLEIIPIPLTTTSTMTGTDYMNLVKASIKTKTVSSVHTSSKIAISMLQGSSSAFLQVEDRNDETLIRNPAHYPTFPATKGDEYHNGKLSFILITSFLSDQKASGKLYALSVQNPNIKIELLKGFDKPTGSCYDVNHDFLYVIENGGENPGIYQFQMQRDYSTLQFKDSSFVILYSGKALDCKVDAYGNLYFTEESDQSLHKITYSDLYFAYINVDMTVISKTKGMDVPSAFELINSEKLFFVNSGVKNNRGTLNLAGVQTGTSKVFEALVQESPLAKGIAVSAEYIYYSLSNGVIRSYSIETGDMFTYSRDLEKPIGLCSSGEAVFAMDYAEGAVYMGKTGISDEMQVLASIQAPYSCFCLNYKEDASLVLSLVFSVFSIFLL